MAEKKSDKPLTKEAQKAEALLAQEELVSQTLHLIFFQSPED